MPAIPTVMGSQADGSPTSLKKQKLQGKKVDKYNISILKLGEKTYESIAILYYPVVTSELE